MKHSPSQSRLRSAIAILLPRAPLIVWIFAMYAFSTDSYSSGETSRFILPVLRAIFPTMSPAGLDALHTVVRKCSHIGEYFVLGLLAYSAFRVDQPNTLRAKIGAGAFLMLIALNDEFHQLFTVSRGASLVDVGYDCFGGVIALWLMGRMEWGDRPAVNRARSGVPKGTGGWARL